MNVNPLNRFLPLTDCFPRSEFTTVFTVFACFISVLAMYVAPSVRAADEGRPNIILAMTDDQGYADVGYMGHPDVRTPTLDTMAGEGLRFDRFYAAAPVCSPTRASVLTGRHPNRMGVFAHGRTLRPREYTIAEALKDAGYRTGHFGKWHLGPMQAGEAGSPGESGFDVWLSAYNFYDLNPWFSDNGKAVHLKGESSIVTAERANRFIENAAADDKSFLAVVWFGSPHTPHETTDELRSLYSDQPENMQNYLGEITGIDRAMKRLRDKLRALDVAQNTVLWFTSDNGGREPEANNGQLRDDKGSLWEGGLRVPAIIEWPGHIDHRITNVPASTSDIYPTVLELAGVERKYPDRPLDGVSLLPLIEGEMSQRPGMGFWEYPSGGRLAYSDRFLKTLHRTRNEGKEAKVRLPLKHTADKNYPGVKKRQGHAAWIDGDWKLHRLNNGNKYELYHLAEDPNEQNNVIDNHPDRTRHMKKALRRWQKSVSDSLHGRDY